MTLDDRLLQEARKAALERSTSLSRLVRDYLSRLIQEADGQRTALMCLEEMFRTTRAETGPRTWKRADLHER
ncbi:MAG: hypothetical protein HY822_22465 [Acidobacteria bacterium]|nr:hypothetical protein [Acidobacteriota bacterium]